MQTLLTFGCNTILILLKLSFCSFLKIENGKTRVRNQFRQRHHKSVQKLPMKLLLEKHSKVAQIIFFNFLFEYFRKITFFFQIKLMNYEFTIRMNKVMRTTFLLFVAESVFFDKRIRNYNKTVTRKTQQYDHT